MFANMYLAYETLSPPIRKLIELAAIHDGEKHYRGRYGNAMAAGHIRGPNTR